MFIEFLIGSKYLDSSFHYISEFSCEGCPNDAATCVLVALGTIVNVGRLINFINHFLITGEDDDLDLAQDPEEDPAVEAGDYIFFLFLDS